MVNENAGFVDKNFEKKIQQMKEAKEKGMTLDEYLRFIGKK
jgi:hypothetical protein